MKVLLKITFNVAIITLSSTVLGQYFSRYTEKDRIKIDVLFDFLNGDQFIIDQQRINIMAIDKNGKLLWRTDPFLDYNLEKYRTKRPTVVSFALRHKGFEIGREVIWICYSNAQFGYLDKKTGAFNFLGQD